MDVETLDPAGASQVLGALETINQRLGGVHATLSHFNRWSRHWTRGETIHIVDWGTGGGDIPRALARWGRGKGYNLRITGVDQNEAVLTYAQEQSRQYPEITLIQADAASFEPGQSVDYAISSLTLHHLTDEAIVALLRKSDQMARRGIVMNDLIRSARAWLWIWTLSRLTMAHSMVRHDGPLSVRRAFTKGELKALAARAGLSYLDVFTHFGYRQTLAGEKPL